MGWQWGRKWAAGLTLSGKCNSPAEFKVKTVGGAAAAVAAAAAEESFFEVEEERKSWRMMPRKLEAELAWWWWRWRLIGVAAAEKSWSDLEWREESVISFQTSSIGDQGNEMNKKKKKMMRMAIRGDEMSIYGCSSLSLSSSRKNF